MRRGRAVPSIRDRWVVIIFPCHGWDDWEYFVIWDIVP